MPPFPHPRQEEDGISQDSARQSYQPIWRYMFMREKIKVLKKKGSEKWVGYPYNVLCFLPDCDCIFDSYHGTVGTDIFPFSLNTRTFVANQVYLKQYEDSADRQPASAEERVCEPAGRESVSPERTGDDPNNRYGKEIQNQEADPYGVLCTDGCQGRRNQEAPQLRGFRESAVQDGGEFHRGRCPYGHLRADVQPAGERG